MHSVYRLWARARDYHFAVLGDVDSQNDYVTGPEVKLVVACGVDVIPVPRAPSLGICW